MTKESVYRCDGGCGSPEVTTPPGTPPTGWRTITIALRVPSEGQARTGREQPKASVYLHLCPKCPGPTDPARVFRDLHTLELQQNRLPAPSGR